LAQWFGLGGLSARRVPWRLVEQQPGDLLVTAPGAYIQGWSGGASVAEFIVWEDWLARQRLVGYQAAVRNVTPTTT
jgi:hypothetical protein